MTDEAVCPENDISGPPPKGEYSHVVLGPETPVSIKTQSFIVNPAAQALALIEAGGANLYVYGDVSYVDTAVRDLGITSNFVVRTSRRANHLLPARSTTAWTKGVNPRLFSPSCRTLSNVRLNHDSRGKPEPRAI
jgi:hypothetical protein